VRRLLLGIEKAAATAVLMPVAVAFGAGVVVWGVARDLQKTPVARVPAVRRVLIWVSGDNRTEPRRNERD
jgi:hypothetical protein